LNANKFMQIVWKASTTVGWATAKDKHVAMYCPKATETKSSFAGNIGGRCVDSGKTYNTCFNKVQRDAANAKRKLHGAVPLKEDAAAGEGL
jgi:hypothetical protein